MADEVADHGFQAHLHWLALGDGHHVHAEGDLQVGILVQVVQHLLGIRVLLQLDDGAHAVAVGLVADVVDAAQLGFLFLGELKDLFQHRGLVDRVGDLIDDDQLAASGAVLDLYLRADGELAAAGLVALADFLVVHQHAAGGEVRAGKVLHQLIQGDLRILDLGDDGADGFAQVVGRDIRGQADSDARCAVHQQIGEACGQHVRLFEGIVEIEAERHGVLLDVPQHQQGQGRHAGFGVSHGGGAVAVDGAEVAVAVHHRAAHGEILSHAHHRVIHGGVAVRMVLTQAVAHDTGTLAVRLVRGGAQLHHGVEDAALNGFEAVLHAGEGALQDDVLCVGDHRLVHHVLNGGLQDAGRIVLGNGTVVAGLLLRHP